MTTRTTKHAAAFRIERSAFLRAGGWAICALLIAGCSADSYRRSADKEAYGLVQQTQGRVLGQTNAFSIDTAYSHRKPADISASELIEDRARTNQRMLTVEAALDLAVKNSREYQNAKETLYSAALKLANTRHDVGWTVTPVSGAAAAWNRDSSGSQSRAATVNNGVTVSRLFRTGGRLTADFLNSIMLYYSGRPDVSFSKIKADLVQPLLRGFGRNNDDVETLTQAERNLVYAVRTYSLYQDEFAVSIVRDYFRLLQQKDAIRNRYTNYLGRVRATQRLEARAVDRERLSDVDQARQAELTAKNNYVDAVARYRTSLDQFKDTLGLPLSEKLYLDDTDLDEVEQTGLVPALLDSNAAYRLALQRQLRVLNYIDQFEDSKRRIRVAADKLKPGLDFSAAASLQSEGTDYTRFNRDRVQVDYVQLQLDLPVDRVPLANDYRAAMIAFESSLRTFADNLDTLKQNIENRLRSLEQNRQNYEIQRNALTLANRRVESTSLLLEAGRAEVRNLIESQDAQISAQNALTAALVTYQETRLQLMLDIGALDADQSKFWLRDHLAAFVPPGTPAPAPVNPSEQAVIPPEESFKN